MDEKARQHAEETAFLIQQLKTRMDEMKNLIKAACDGAIGSSTTVASFQPFDLAHSCGWATWKDSGLSSLQIQFPR